MSKRTFVIGDIHGGYKALKQLLAKVELTAEDTLILLGDLVDGWSESYEVVEFLIEIEQTNSCIFIKGNHDLYCEYWLATGETNENWQQHGGMATISGYKDKSEDDKQRHISFFRRMKYYHIDEQNRLFVHAGFTSLHGPEKEQSESNFIWDRTLLELALATDDRLPINSPRYPKRLKHFYEIYIGHTPTQNYGSEQPIHATNLYDIDTGAAFKGRLTAMEIDTKELWQSEPVYLLYPKEKGRNKI